MIGADFGVLIPRSKKLIVAAGDRVANAGHPVTQPAGPVAALGRKLLNSRFPVGRAIAGRAATGLPDLIRTLGDFFLRWFA
jgi:hypothetical protein